MTIKSAIEEFFLSPRPGEYRRNLHWQGEDYEIMLWFTGWSRWALGASVDWSLPNFEIHLPCCFIRAGRRAEKSYWANRWLQERGPLPGEPMV